MNVSPHILDEIRARLPVSTVVGRKVRLKKAGREWRGLSPFNVEKTPSFYAHDDKGRWFDHSAGKNGDIFAFLMEAEGLTFPEAVERLAAEAGVDLPKVSPEAVATAERHRTLHDVVEIAAAYFERVLAGTDGQSARAYLDSRGIGPETCRLFRLGYATESRHGLIDHLGEKSVSRELMLETGLIVLPEDAAYDKFRDRVIFPIQDVRGRVVAFGGRAMRDGKGPKYLNSPETPLFDKGRVLYNFHRARPLAHERGRLLIVEGYVDAIALSAAGFGDVVAPLGTSLTAEHLQMAWHTAAEPTLMFDGDAAGKRAAGRGIDLALPHLEPGRSLRIVHLPPGMDPDDLVRAEGPSGVNRSLLAAVPLVEALWQRETAFAPHDTPERRAGLRERLLTACDTIRHREVRSEYQRAVRDRLFRLGRATPPRSTKLTAAAMAIFSRPVKVEPDVIGLAEEQRIAAEMAETAEALGEHHEQDGTGQGRV